MSAGSENMKQDKPVRPRSAMHTELSTRKPSGRLGRDVQNKIGQQLRAMYDDVVNQGVPERFANLLRKLDEKSDKEPG
jgi:hypothetical protein